MFRKVVLCVCSSKLGVLGSSSSNINMANLVVLNNNSRTCLSSLTSAKCTTITYNNRSNSSSSSS